MPITRTSRVVKQTTYRAFCHAELCHILQVPDDSRIYMNVPGGGDWSNTSLEVGNKDDAFLFVVSETVTGENT